MVGFLPGCPGSELRSSCLCSKVFCGWSHCSSSQFILYLLKDVTCHPSVLQHVCFRYLFPTILRSKMGDLEQAVAWEEPAWKPSCSSFRGWGLHPFLAWPFLLVSSLLLGLRSWAKIVQGSSNAMPQVGYKSKLSASRNVISVESKIELLALHSIAHCDS